MLEALGSSYYNQPCGTLGAAALSFNGNVLPLQEAALVAHEEAKDKAI